VSAQLRCLFGICRGDPYCGQPAVAAIGVGSRRRMLLCARHEREFVACPHCQIALDSYVLASGNAAVSRPFGRRDLATMAGAVVIAVLVVFALVALGFTR
jgi:hypothetical protein